MGDSQPITYLYFSTMEYCGSGCTEVEIKVEGDSLYCRSAGKLLDERISGQKWCKVSTVQPEEWNNRLEEIKIRNWKPEYRPPEGVVILDGTQWEVHLTAGRRTRHIYGDNAFPAKWETLEDFMIEVLAGASL